MCDRRVIRTKQLIKDALIRLMERKKLAEITVSELAREAGVDRRTFYLHYDNIYDIVAEIDDEAIQKLEKAVCAWNPAEGQDYFDVYTDIMLSNLSYYERIIKDRSYYTLEHRCKEIMRNDLLNHLRKDSQMDPLTRDFYAEYVASGIINMYTHWIRTEKPMPVEQLTQMVREAVTESWPRLMAEIR